MTKTGIEKNFFSISLDKENKYYNESWLFISVYESKYEKLFICGFKDDNEEEKIMIAQNKKKNVKQSDDTVFETGVKVWLMETNRLTVMGVIESNYHYHNSFPYVCQTVWQQIKKCGFSQTIRISNLFGKIQNVKIQAKRLLIYLLFCYFKNIFIDNQTWCINLLLTWSFTFKSHISNQQGVSSSTAVSLMKLMQIYRERI